MSAADFVYDPTVEVNIASTMSSQEAFKGGLLAAGLAVIIAVIVVLADLRQSVLNLSLELYRADSLVKSFPLESTMRSSIQRYIKKRKVNKFNLGVLNDIVSMQDHEVDDNMSIASSNDENSSCLHYAYYHLYTCCRGNIGSSPSYTVPGHKGASANARTYGMVHPDPETSTHSISGYHYSKTNEPKPEGTNAPTEAPWHIAIKKPQPPPNNTLYDIYTEDFQEGAVYDNFCI